MQLILQHRYDDAIAQLQKVLGADPASIVAHCNLWEALSLKQMYEQAFAEAKKCSSRRLTPNTFS